jgi:uncharacterized membrane protein YkoI
MKKFPILLCAAALLCGTALTGCGSDNATSQETESTVSSAVESTDTMDRSMDSTSDAANSDSSSANGIDPVAIAKKNANLPDGTVVQNELEIEDGVEVYHIILEKELTRFEFKIRASDGAILDWDADYSYNASSGIDIISPTEALAIAEKAVDVSAETVTKNERDYDDGVLVYEITFVTDGIEYDFEIDAATGTIREQKQESLSDTVSDDGTTISADEALSIARDAAGISGGTVTKNKLDYDEGFLVYEIKIVENGIEYEFEISATRGTVLEQSQEAV